MSVAGLLAAGLGLSALQPQEEPNLAQIVGVSVVDCYSSTPPFEVELDGRRLELTPASERDDSVGLCFAGTLPDASKTAHVRLTRNGHLREFRLMIGKRTKILVIEADDLSATTSDKVLMLD